MRNTALKAMTQLPGKYHNHRVYRAMRQVDPSSRMTLGIAIMYPQAFDNVTSQRCKLMRQIWQTVPQIDLGLPTPTDTFQSIANLLYATTGTLRPATLSIAIITSILHTITNTDLLNMYFNHVLEKPIVHNTRAMLQDRLCFNLETHSEILKECPVITLNRYNDHHNTWCTSYDDQMHRSTLKRGLGEGYQKYITSTIEQRMTHWKKLMRKCK